ncbi:MAG: hypothetical protein ILNGONEN_02327 [Syntrophorhabdaceae bacterium]|nr:hypothetical protein [Syntrophorhabdaceae bacterium]
MPLSTLMLVIIAAVLHAVWNFVAKKVENKQVVSWWAILTGSGLVLPFVLPHAQLPTMIWPYLLGSALAEAIYYFMLIRAYENADFSLTYPIARGVAPAFIMLWSILFIHEWPTMAGIVGIMIILLGLLVVGAGQYFFKRLNQPVDLRAVGMALTVALIISVYSIIDATAVRVVSPFPYLIIVLTTTGVLMMPVVVVRYGYRHILLSWRTNFREIAMIAVLIPLTYGLVLQAYALAPMSYVGAIREVSIVLAAFAGWRWLGEDFGRVRFFGAICIFAGILVIAMMG